MNYFAHAWVACRLQDAPGFVLGAMLPDLAGFLRIRLPVQPDPEVAAGHALHHETDRVFHDLAGFRTRNREGARVLREAGVARGPARAAAHVGLELALDGVLAERCAPTRRHFRGALAEIGRIATAHPADADSLARMATRLREADALAWNDAATVTERVHRTLAGRPALTLDRAGRRSVAHWLGATLPDLSAEAEPLARETLAALRGSETP